MKHVAALFLVLAAASSWPATFAAAQAGPTRYALLIGSNEGGPGQAPLRYAEDDARRMGDVLRTLGGYDEERIDQLLHPTPEEVNDALDRMHERLAAEAAAGAQAQLFFYYSGHARADALNLGPAQLSLAALRKRVLALPATLSIVVLDACQSGAFSRIKGANRAADFSFNSVERLNTAGVAVIASSSGQELSQESDELQSGYFTHHLLVALRGGGDADGDGRVTLSEAYDYAYRQTLAATAVTAVGEQHVTLETDLQGKGDIALTRPASASARLRVPASWRGRVLVQRLPSLSVLAELDKPISGRAVDLALPPGPYTVTVRGDGRALRCQFQLLKKATVTLDASWCGPAPLHDARPKLATPIAWSGGAAESARSGEEGFVLELLVGLGGRNGSSAYDKRLETFVYSEESAGLLRFSASAGRRVHDHLVLGLSWFNLDNAQYQRANERVEQAFELDAHAFGAWVQGDYSFGPQRFIFFVRAGGGLVLASTELDAVNAESSFVDTDPSFEDITTPTHKVDQQELGAYVAFGGGLQVMLLKYLGFMVEARYAIAPTLENELGDTHDLGGIAVLTGLRLRTWE